MANQRCLEGLTIIAECYQPLLFAIAEFVAESPRDVAHFCCLCAFFLVSELSHVADSLWSGLYMRRWPAFHECMRHEGAIDWCMLYRDTLAGQCECTLEVFDREKKRGFAMSAMPARVQYESKGNMYIARYLSASMVLPEAIVAKEEHRLRFCPAPAREQLLPAGGKQGAAFDADQREAYPYKVLEGVGELVPGQGVELQWKMQEGSPFGWWYGHLESIRFEKDGLATACITFRHFPPASRWYCLNVRFGDGHRHPCTFGGYTGGVRAVSEADRKQWMYFFPKEPLAF